MATSKQTPLRLKGHKTCCIADCFNRTDNRPDLCYHEFPSDAQTSKHWEKLAKRGDKEFCKTKYRHVCSEHFLPSDYRRSLTGRRLLISGTVPSIFKAREKKNDCLEESPREKRYKLKALSERNENVPSTPTSEVNNTPSPSCIIDENYYQLCISQLEEEIMQLRSAIMSLENKVLESRFALSRFSSDSADISFFTGFPDYSTLMIFWEKIEPSASNLTRWECAKCKASSNKHSKFPYLSDAAKIGTAGRHKLLQPIDEFFLVLTRLRLGLFERDLSHRFNVSISTVSDIVITWINFLYIEMGSWPLWIEHSVIRENLPSVFRGEYEDTIAIIDCTEFKCEVPKDPVKQSEFYSEYKSHDTFKGLIGISPHAAVTFVSQLYGGHISDREITVESGLCNFLKRGDKLMADKGFNIQDILAKYGVVLFVPPKRKPGQIQFTEKQVLETQRIARVRIHVERAISRVKGWHIFDQVIPLSLHGSINQIWTICCLLVNFQNPTLSC